MQIGMVGLGRMGGNMARRLVRGGHRVIGFATDPAAVEQIAREGATGTDDPRPAGEEADQAAGGVGDGAGRGPTEATVKELAGPMERATRSSTAGTPSSRTTCGGRPQGVGIHYIDVGTSGGVWGMERGTA